MRIDYYPQKARRHRWERRLLATGAICLALGIVALRFKMLDKFYYKSVLSLSVADDAKLDAVRKWAEIVVREGHPQDVFELVPDAPRMIHDDVTYVTVQWQKPRYIWASKTEAGITHLHPSVWGEVIGAVEWPDKDSE